MSHISETTGLPELPEGQWWEVRETTISSSHYAIFNADWEPYQVAIRETQAFVTPEMPGKRWWNRPTPAKTNTKTCDIATALITGTLNPRNIRKAAFGLIERRNRESKQFALLGSYPPKKLDKTL